MRHKSLKTLEIERRVAAEILTELMFVKDINDIIKIYDKFYQKYDLEKDPFTSTPCDYKTYEKVRTEYLKQMFNERL